VGDSHRPSRELSSIPMQPRPSNLRRIFIALSATLIVIQLGYVAFSAYEMASEPALITPIPVAPTPTAILPRSAAFNDKVPLQTDLETAMNYAPKSSKAVSDRSHPLNVAVDWKMRVGHAADQDVFIAPPCWERIASAIRPDSTGFALGEPGTPLLFLGKRRAGVNSQERLVAIEIVIRAVGDSPGFYPSDVRLVEACSIDPKLGLPSLKENRASLTIVRDSNRVVVKQIYLAHIDPSDSARVKIAFDYDGIGGESKTDGVITATLREDGKVDLDVFSEN